MASQALYRKWRSQTFEEIIGQQHVTQTLVNALKLDRVAHAYLFTGPRGTGKTSTARLLAKAVNCQAEDVGRRPCNQCSICTAVTEGRLLDLIEIDAASNTGVDDIRDLRDKVGFRPGEASIKFYIIDEVHMLSNSAFNALLKTLEEPPAHVIFVLATTEPEKIPATITSRCQRFDFKRIKLADISGRLAYIVEQEGLQAEPEALEYIARQAGGSMRDAISLLDQLTAYGGETITLELVQTVLGAVTSQAVTGLVEALIDKDVPTGLDIINSVIHDGLDPRQFAREIVEYLRALMLVKLGDGASLLSLPEELLQVMKNQAIRIDGPRLVRMTALFNTALVDIKAGWLTIPQLPLELALVEAAVPEQPAAPPPAAEAAPAAKAPAETPPVAKPPPAPVARPQPIPPPPPEEPAAETVVELAEVQRCFEPVVKILEPKSKVMAETLRFATQPYKIEGRTIYLLITADDPDDSTKKRFEQPIPQQAINDAFSQALGQSVHVRFLSQKAVGGSHSGQESQDALIKAAQNLGGKVADES